MYLPKFKQTTTLYTAGEEFTIKTTGENYVGYYIKTSKGTLYTGETFNKKQSQELAPTVASATSTHRYVGRESYDDAARVTENQLQLKETQPLPSLIYTPDYTLLTNRRFFAKSKINQNIIEISKETFRELSNKVTTYHYPSYDITFLDWDLSSPVEDTRNGSYIIEGSITKNKKQVMKLDKTLPGLYAYLTQTEQL